MNDGNVQKVEGASIFHPAMSELPAYAGEIKCKASSSLDNHVRTLGWWWMMLRERYSIYAFKNTFQDQLTLETPTESDQ